MVAGAYRASFRRPEFDSFLEGVRAGPARGRLALDPDCPRYGVAIGTGYSEMASTFRTHSDDGIPRLTSIPSLNAVLARYDFAFLRAFAASEHWRSALGFPHSAHRACLSSESIDHRSIHLISWPQDTHQMATRNPACSKCTRLDQRETPIPNRPVISRQLSTTRELVHRRRERTFYLGERPGDFLIDLPVNAEICNEALRERIIDSMDLSAFQPMSIRSGPFLNHNYGFA
jgi:hypothetical protein